MTIHRTWHTLININNMKFTRAAGLFNFLHIRFCELQKASEPTPVEKMLLATHDLLITGCTPGSDVYCSKQTGSSSTKETITFHHFFVSGIGQKKTVRCRQNLAARNVDKTVANIRKWIARFYYFDILCSAGSACVLLTIITGCPSIWATLSALLIK